MKKSIILIFLLLITACAADNDEVGGNHNPDIFHVMFLSEVPSAYQEALIMDIEDILQDELEENGVEVRVDVLQTSYDKLAVEIFNKEVDLFVVSEQLQNILLDPYGLKPLDELEGSIPEATYYEDLIMEAHDSDQEFLFALRFDENTKIREDMGLQLDSSLLAGVVNTSPHQEMSLRLLEEWL